MRVVKKCFRCNSNVIKSRLTPGKYICKHCNIVLDKTEILRQRYVPANKINKGKNPMDDPKLVQELIKNVKYGVGGL